MPPDREDGHLKELIDALQEGEVEARADTEGYIFFNGVRYVDHPAECACRSGGFSFASHCWCCGYAQPDSRCHCDTAGGICAKCGKCTVDCRC